MAFPAVAAAATGAILGGMGGSRGGGGTQTQSQTMTLDPRMQEAIYGGGGIVPTLSNWYSKNNNGMNAQMLQGLNQQYQTLNDPFTKAGYDRMGSNGYNLMAGGVAGNPFTSGQASLQGGMQPMQGGMPMSLMPQAQSGMGFGSLGLSNSGPVAMPETYTPPPPPPPVQQVAPILSFAQQMDNWQREKARENRTGGGGK